MTELEAYIEMLRRAGVDHSVEVEQRREDWTFIFNDNVRDAKTVSVVRIVSARGAGNGHEETNGGYSDFYCLHLFDSEGQLVRVEVWE